MAPRVVRILDAVQHYHQLRAAAENLLQFRILPRGAERHHALMRGIVGSAVQRLARLEAQRNGALARRVDDLLQARTARAPRNQYPVQRPSRAQRLAHRMHPGENPGGVGLALGWPGSFFAPRSLQCIAEIGCGNRASQW